jgi:hypothetical protein
MLRAALTSVAIGLTTAAAAQHDVGNGGDPLMLIFTKARADAHLMLRVVAATGVPEGIDADVRDFLTEIDPPSGLRRIEALADDVKSSQQKWHEGDVFHDRCAATNMTSLPPGDRLTVHLSLPRCRTVLLGTAAGESEAARLLIHEGTHHFGIGGSDAEEDKASRIAGAVYALWLAQRQAGEPIWTETALQDVPEARYQHTAVWTGDGDDPDVHGKLIIWGGCNYSKLPNKEDCAHYLSSGGRLAVSRRAPDGTLPTTKWEPLDDSTAPLGRSLHTAVWTGESSEPLARRKMIVFGGCRGDDVACDQAFAVTACPGGNGRDCDDPAKDRAIYDAATNTWRDAATERAPSPRVMHTAVWTGREMIVWGGLEGWRNAAIEDRPLGDGGRLAFVDARTDALYPKGSWQAIEPGVDASAPSPRFGHTATWTGKEMIVWGGCERPGLLGCTRYFDDGAAYDPGANDGAGSWRRLAPSGIEARVDHSAAWTGRFLIVWGGRNASGPLASGAAYDSVTGQWSRLPSLLPPGELGRYAQQAAWDGLQGRMVVWGGQQGGDVFPTSTLLLVRDVDGAWRWRVAPTAVAPIGRKGHASAWVRDALLVWGGFAADDTFVYTGGLFNP